MGVLLGGLACGSTEESTVETTPAPSVECPDESWEKLTLELVREDEAAQCLRTEPEERVAVPFCLNPASSGQSFRCVRDEAGTDYVVFASESLILRRGSAFARSKRSSSYALATRSVTSPRSASHGSGHSAERRRRGSPDIVASSTRRTTRTAASARSATTGFAQPAWRASSSRSIASPS